ncbi:MAG: helix-turn-helix transcriptional regulator [Fuerstiella sp.]|nr:helix-turn-helix transcriptional regulator [Fuerstiella sp.]MCP4853056.1 helix-turn-helix transcriptional regulator [Fuerstiella sp.]
MKFCQHVQHYRRANDWSQNRLATAINRSRSAVATWDSGQSVPDFVTGCQIAEVLGITPGELLHGPGQFAANLVALRYAQRISGLTMANHLRMKFSTLENIELGRRVPSEDAPLTAKFAKQFACSPTVLYGEIDICDVFS